jgi:hypothetical protein
MPGRYIARNQTFTSALPVSLKTIGRSSVIEPRVGDGSAGLGDLGSPAGPAAGLRQQEQFGPRRLADGAGTEFLLETSVLARLSGPLCDAVSGRADGQAMLETIETANLFLPPLDEVRGRAGHSGGRCGRVPSPTRQIGRSCSCRRGCRRSLNQGESAAVRSANRRGRRSGHARARRYRRSWCGG